MMVNDCRRHVSTDYLERERDKFGGDRPTLKARKRMTDEFRKNILHNNPVRLNRRSESYIAAARKAKGIRRGRANGHDQKRRRSNDSCRWCLIAMK